MNAAHPYWFVFASFSLALLPIVIGLCTSFVKVHVVLSFFRVGLGAQQVPSGLVLLGLSVAMTIAVMSPTLDAFHQNVQSFPWKKVQHHPNRISAEQVQELLDPWYQFLLLHSGERELIAFSERAESVEEEPQAVAPVPWKVLLPAFLVTELREAFVMGFVVLLPFLVIDLIVANILAGVGMFMVSPIMISLPLKVALFTFADGWLLLTGGLTGSYGL